MKLVYRVSWQVRPTLPKDIMSGSPVFEDIGIYESRTAAEDCAAHHPDARVHPIRVFYSVEEQNAWEARQRLPRLQKAALAKLTKAECEALGVKLTIDQLDADIPEEER